MANKMLVDAAHPEETRVVVLRGNRVEEFDFESASRKQLRGNIYLAKVTRVEPSLQAAFVDYGGNRHGFLAFSEIHPDYYQIPVADRQALIEAERREIDEGRPAARLKRAGRGRRRRMTAERRRSSEPAPGDERPAILPSRDERARRRRGDDRRCLGQPSRRGHLGAEATARAGRNFRGRRAVRRAMPDSAPASEAEAAPAITTRKPATHDAVEVVSDDQVESVGAEDALEELPERRRGRPRQYKIQEVIKRRQVLLVQVVKEERGNKGAALTTYLSLAGRYSVLMPNTARGGGISRKITSPADRKR